MRSTMLRLLCLSLALAAPARAAEPADTPLLGFDDPARQRQLEARFDGLLRADNLREWMKRLAARPHHLGSAYTKENAEFIASQFRSWGYDTQIEEFHVLFPTPKTRLLEMVAPGKFTAALAEPPVPEDATSGQTDEQLPSYNCYSVDGDVTGELVYVNYGVPADYEALAENGVDVKGKIVIARYGGSWRGIKPKVAAEHGAVGCIIYSDPADDGYFQGDVYPKGPFRNENGVQRGSVADMPIFAGDPLTPGVGATKDARRVPVKEAVTLTKIPVLPISYADALPLLRAIDGPVAPEGWRGALPISYHLGPGPARVRLKLEFNWDVVPAYDVVAKLAGAERPDQWIIRGNHYDAWVNGADDPISGMVALMEEARAVGELARSGWRPKRTIVYCAWDGEEQGLLGSTEWAETHADLLKKNAVAYVNTDSNGRGFLSMGGSHTLERFVNEVARDVADPQKKISVADRARARAYARGGAAERADLRSRADLRISALGSGSDYTPFLQHLGIASLNLGYGGEDSGGSYHSVYDSVDHYTRFGDPGFAYGVALAKTAGRIVLRLANADVLPFEFTSFADTVGRYVKEVAELAETMRAETDERNRMIAEKMFEAVSDPTKPYVVPPRQEPVPHLNFAPLQNALRKLEESARAYDRASAARLTSGRPLAPGTARQLDRIFMGLERALTRAEGLPGRPWYVHQVYAPGLYAGYGVKTLPAVREAMELRRWKEAEAQVPALAQTLEKFAAEVDRAAELVRQAAGRE
jgi:N-acetylated-alpha-linked acidic dipeptidase